jgi:hypothetical protein
MKSAGFETHDSMPSGQAMIVEANQEQLRKSPVTTKPSVRFRNSPEGLLVNEPKGSAGSKAAIARHR